MPRISANVTKKELDAISEYANACGEIMSNLIRKCLISDAVFRNFYGDAKDYDFSLQIPNELSGSDEDKIILDTYNNIRNILNLKQNNYI